MLFLLFRLGESRYVLATRDVVEVVPGIRLTRLPTAPDYVAGLFNYRGTSVPVIDVSSLLLQQASAPHLSTRVALVKVPVAGDDERLLGLLIEQATETVKIDEHEFVDPGIQAPDAACLGPVYPDTDGLITRLEPRRVLQRLDQNILFPEHRND